MIHASKRAVSAVLLANHGPIVAGPDLRSAVFAAEELEETAKLMHILPHPRVVEERSEETALSKTLQRVRKWNPCPDRAGSRERS